MWDNYPFFFFEKQTYTHKRERKRGSISLIVKCYPIVTTQVFFFLKGKVSYFWDHTCPTYPFATHYSSHSFTSSLGPPYLFLFLFISLYFCLFIFTLSYYKFVTISSILYIVFPHNKKALSLSLSINFLVDFYFLFFLHFYFRLIVFYIL